MTLSTAESELMASIECAVSLESIQALLHTVGFDIADERVLHVESQASLAISNGHRSWRTRHLRVRAEYLREQYLREQTRSEKLKLVFCPGAEQLADLLTKALPSSRIEELVQVWGMRNFDSADANHYRPRRQLSLHTRQRLRKVKGVLRPSPQQP